MLEEDPVEARDIMKQLAKPAGAHRQARRDYKVFFKQISSWAKSREKSAIAGMIKCDKGEFRMHWKMRGKSSGWIKKKWAKSTTGKQFRKGKAWHVDRGRNKAGKKRKQKIVVWVKEQERAEDKTTWRNEVKQHRGEEDVDETAGRHRMKQKLELDKEMDADVGITTTMLLQLLVLLGFHIFYRAFRVFKQSC